MDRPFDPADWQPTKPPDPRDKDLEPELPGLIATLGAQTERIYRQPYNPSYWVERGKTLQRLRYPELAVADGYKASLLCGAAIDLSIEDPRWRLGFGAGFQVLDESGTTDEQSDVKGWLDRLSSQAEQLVIDNLYYFPQYMHGRNVRKGYPWLSAKHRVRDDDLIEKINGEFAESARWLETECAKYLRARDKLKAESAGPYGILQRHAFGRTPVDADGNSSSSEVLGVFAACDIRKGKLIMADDTRLWGCMGPGSHPSDAMPSTKLGCQDPTHPNLATETAAQNLRWVRDVSSGRSAAQNLLRCRSLITCISDTDPTKDHPLDHPLIARLTPSHPSTKATTFSFDGDIVTPIHCLQQFGIDVFANANCDTWVVFTLESRLRNNSWSNPVHKCVSPLFSLFNHSCDPNVTWNVQYADTTTLELDTIKAVKKGEQLFVMYNGYTCDQPLETRRTALRRWFDTDCQCSLCKHEEANGLYGGTEIKDAERREGDRSESSSEEEDDDDDDESSGDSDGSDSLLHPSACECEFCISSREFFERVRNGEWRADETLREFPEDEDGSFDPEMDCASME